jgi:hypothetical protein
LGRGESVDRGGRFDFCGGEGGEEGFEGVLAGLVAVGVRGGCFAFEDPLVVEVVEVHADSIFFGAGEEFVVPGRVAFVPFAVGAVD